MGDRWGGASAGPLQPGVGDVRRQRRPGLGPHGDPLLVVFAAVCMCVCLDLLLVVVTCYVLVVAIVLVFYGGPLLVERRVSRPPYVCSDAQQREVHRSLSHSRACRPSHFKLGGGRARAPPTPPKSTPSEQEQQESIARRQYAKPRSATIESDSRPPYRQSPY